MAIVVLQDFPGGTTEQYDQISAQLNLGGHSPEGNLFHTAGLVDGNLRIVDVWESESALNAFMARVQPLIQSAGGPQPVVTVWPTHHILTPRGYAIGG